MISVLDPYLASVCDPQLAISVSDELTTIISFQNIWMISDRVSHLMIYTKLQRCRSVVSYPVDYFKDPSCIDPVDFFADPPHVSLVDLLADLHVDLIFLLLPLCNMVSPLLEHSMHLWTADWVMYWLLSHRRVVCIFSLSISKMRRIFQVLLSWNCCNSLF